MVELSIFIIIVGMLALMLIAYLIKKSFVSIAFLSLISLFVGFFFIEALGFKDGTTEVINTIMVSILLPGSIVDFIWVVQYISGLKEKKIHELRESIIEEYENNKGKLSLEKKHLEKELHVSRSKHNLLMLLQSCNSEVVDFYENQQLSLNRDYIKEVVKNIEQNKSKIKLIDKGIMQIRKIDDYAQLLKVKRGDMQ